MKIKTVILIIILSMAPKLYGEPVVYKTWAPWEVDSALAAWTIKTYVNTEAQFISIPKGTQIKSEFSIDVPMASPYLRSAKITAFEEVLRVHKIDNDCVKRIRPIVRLLELAKWRKSENPDAVDFEFGLKPLLPLEPVAGNLNEAFDFIDQFCNSQL